MLQSWHVALLGVLLFLTPGSPLVAQPPANPKLDILGDPLPPGAIVRLGTVRFWHGGTVNALAISPDGKYLASAGRNDAGEDPDAMRNINLWEFPSGKWIRGLGGFPNGVYAVAFSPDGKSMASGRDEVIVWDVVTGKEKITFHRQGINFGSIEYSPDGKLIATTDTDSTISLWDSTTGTHLRSLEDFSVRITDVAFSPDGEALVTSDGRGNVSLWDVRSGAKKWHVKPHPHWVNSIVFSPKGSVLATANSLDRVHPGILNSITFLDPATGEERLRVWEGSEPVGNLAFSPDGRFFIARVGEESLQVWNVVWKNADGSNASVPKVVEKCRWTSSGNNFKANAFSPDGRILATGGWRKFVQLVEMDTGKPFGEQFEGFASCDFSPDGSDIVTGEKDGQIRIWDTALGRQKSVWKGHEKVASAVRYLPEGILLVSGGLDDAIRFWDPVRVGCLREIRADLAGVTTMVLTRDARWLAAGGLDQSVKVWKLEDLANPGKFRADEMRKLRWDPIEKSDFGEDENVGVQALDIASGGGWVAAGGLYSDVHLWDVGTGQDTVIRIKTSAPTFGVSSLCFSPDTKTLAVAAFSPDTYFLLFPDWKQAPFALSRGHVRGHSTGKTRLSYSGDGALFVMTDYVHGSVSVMRGDKLNDMKHLYTFKGHRDPINAVTLSRDGARLATASDDRTVLIWDLKELHLQTK